jgi:hypothetical protein
MLRRQPRSAITPTTAIADLVPDLKLAQRALVPHPPPSASAGQAGTSSTGEASSTGSGGSSSTNAHELPTLNNTRFNPKPAVIAGALKRLRRELRGRAAVGEWERVNILVREQLIQQDVRASSAHGSRATHPAFAVLTTDTQPPCTTHSQVVLLFVPFTVSTDGDVVGIVVLASGWSLRMARLPAPAWHRLQARHLRR